MLNMLDAGLHKTHEWAPIHKTYRTRQGHYVAHYLVGDRRPDISVSDISPIHISNRLALFKTVGH